MTDHKEISKAFHMHFSKTYNTVSTCVTKTFVGTFRRLDSDSVSALEVPFTQEEFNLSIVRSVCYGKGDDESLAMSLPCFLEHLAKVVQELENLHGDARIVKRVADIMRNRCCQNDNQTFMDVGIFRYSVVHLAVQE
ncbi:hypothetical protein V6N13_043479 [Hibiscus sabdariffa]